MVASARPQLSALAIASAKRQAAVFECVGTTSPQARYSVLTRPQGAGGRARALWSPIASRIAFLAEDPAGTPFTAVLDWPELLARPGPGPPQQAGDLVRLVSNQAPHFTHPDPPVRRLPAVDWFHSFTSEGWLLARRAGEWVQLDLESSGAVEVIPSAHRFDYCERSRVSRFLAGYNPEPKDCHCLLLDEFQPAHVNYWELAGHTGDLRCRAIAPESQRIVTGSADHTARVWAAGDLSRRTNIAVLQGHTDEVTAVAWSPDGQLIATGSKDRTIRLWAAAATNQWDEPPALLQPAFPPLLLSAAGVALVAGTRAVTAGNQQLAVWQPDRGASIELPSDAPLIPRQLTSGGRELLTVGGAANRIELRRWSVAAGTNTLVQTLALPDDETLTPAPADWTAASDLRWLTCADAAGRVRVWPLGQPGGKPLSFAGQLVPALAFSPRLNILAVARNDSGGGLRGSHRATVGPPNPALGAQLGRPQARRRRARLQSRGPHAGLRRWPHPQTLANRHGPRSAHRVPRPPVWRAAPLARVHRRRRPVAGRRRRRPPIRRP